MKTNEGGTAQKEQGKKYTFSLSDRARWFEDKSDPFKIKGNVEEIIQGIEGGRNGTIAGRQDENGEGFVIPKFKTVEERERYAAVEKEHKILSQIHVRLHQIEEENQKLIASTGIEAFERIQKGIEKIKAEISDCWNQLNPETKREFEGSEISGVLNTRLLKSSESNKPTQPQIALFYRYLVQAGLEQPITVSNRDEVAKKFGYTAPTSGQKIYDWFNKLNTTTQRTAQGKYTVKNLEAVIKLLNGYPAAKTIAEEELKIARRNNQ